MAIKREETKSVSVKFPVSLIEEIDQICSANYTPRTSWLIKAARNLIDKERVEGTEQLLTKFADKER